MYQEIKNKFHSLETKLSSAETQQNTQEMVRISREHATLKKVMALILEWEKVTENIQQNQEIVKTEADGEFKEMASDELSTLSIRQGELEDEIDEEINPASPNDKKNAIIEIRAGAGGDEAALFAGDLFRMYARFCERQGWKLSLIDSSVIGIGGYKEIIFSVSGESAYGSLKFEAGTHRVQRVPETEKQGRVHTSTATVVALPEAEEVDIEIKASDIRIDTFCSSGPGGQSVNTTYSAIRVTHLPTGVTVSCQDQKSQHQNKEKALQVLRSRLLARQEEERLAEQSSTRKNQIGAGDRSDKIRTYNFPQDRVTDHRVNLSWHSLTRIMDGEIADIVASLKKADKESRS